jgi:thymidylate synthase
MNRFHGATLGEAWVELLQETLRIGTRLGAEGYELLRVEVSFPAGLLSDPLIERFGDPAMTSGMEQVFFGSQPNSLGHSYAQLMIGPGGRSDLSDVVALLREQPLSKRAVVTFCPAGNGKVPCLNVIQFLVREGKLQTVYFARGQDAFRKFYADGWCVAQMARRVAKELRVPVEGVTGFIGSSHIYEADLAAVRQMLDQAAGVTRPALETEEANSAAASLQFEKGGG